MDQQPATEQNPIPQPQPITQNAPAQPEIPEVKPKKYRLVFGIITMMLVTVALSFVLYTLTKDTAPGQNRVGTNSPGKPSVEPTNATVGEADISSDVITAIIMDKNNAYAVEYCDYPWDYKPVEATPADKVCIEAETSGNIKKTFYGANPLFDLIYSNSEATEEQYASASATALKLYQQLTDQAVFDWLQKPKVPPVGSTYSHIKLHAIHTGDYEVIGTYTITFDQAPSYSKVTQIIEELKSLAK